VEWLIALRCNMNDSRFSVLNQLQSRGNIEAKAFDARPRKGSPVSLIGRTGSASSPRHGTRCVREREIRAVHVCIWPTMAGKHRHFSIQRGIGAPWRQAGQAGIVIIHDFSACKPASMEDQDYVRTPHGKVRDSPLRQAL
jgi:hypothetical protein